MGTLFKKSVKYFCGDMKDAKVRTNNLSRGFEIIAPA